MARKISLAFAASLTAVSAFGQLQQACLSLSGSWSENSIGGAVQMNDGGFAVVGLYKSSNSDPYRALVTKLDANGAILWRMKYDFGASLNTWASSVVATSDGGLAVAGDTWSNWDGTGRNAYILKLDANGAVQWAKAYMHPTYAVHVDLNSGGLIQTSDDGFALIGHHIDAPPGTFDNLMLRTDDQGNVLWSDDIWYAGTPAEVAQMDDGDLVFAGWATLSGAPVIVRKNGLDGTTIWKKWYAIPGDRLDVTAVVAGPDNTAVLAGLRYDTALDPGALPVVFSLDSTGTPGWMTQVAFAQPARPGDMARHPSGDYVISGRMNDMTTFEDSAGFVMRVDDAGQLVWAEWMKHQGGPITRLVRCSIAADGDILLAGEFYYQYQIMEKIAADGTPCPGCPVHLEGTASSDVVAIAPDQGSTVLGNWATAYDLTGITTASPLTATFAGTTCGASTVDEVASEPVLTIQPNPCMDHFTITIASDRIPGKSSIELLDATGRVVLIEPAGGTSTRIDASRVSPGSYLVRLVSDQNARIAGRIEVLGR